MPVTFVLATQFQSQAHSDSTECKMSGKHSTYVAMYKHKDGGGKGRVVVNVGRHTRDGCWNGRCSPGDVVLRGW